MVRSLRERPADQALLYGQGGHVTKHHALVVGNRAAEAAWLMLPRDVQDAAEDARGDVPRHDPGFTGAARIESFSIVFGRDGQPSHGSVIARTGDGTRAFARVDVADAAAMATLLSLDASPVGREGHVSRGGDGLQHWAMR
jgi:hypothetical protein